MHLMKVVTAGEMREIDRRTIEDIGIPGIVLMENAGRAVADAAGRVLGSLTVSGSGCDGGGAAGDGDTAGNVAGRRVCIFAGKGNNGGDGFVAARYLANRGARVKAFLLGKKEEVKGDAAVNLAALARMGLEVEELSQGELHKARVAISISDIVIDAIFGTGFKGEISGLAALVIEAINDSSRPVISVDIPSGVDADTGGVAGRCVRASYTVTMGLPKVGLMLYPGALYAGNVVVADIGIPSAFASDERLRFNMSTSGYVRGLLPARHPDSHKGDFGRILVIAGSEGMIGAAALTCLSALRTGAGLVTLGIARSLHDLMEIKLTEVITRPLPETEARSLSIAAQGMIESTAKRADVLAIGPGLSTNSETAQLVRNLLVSLNMPAVVDADALNAIAQDISVLRAARAPLVLTPHGGEMARLLGVNVNEVKRDRLATACRAARQWGKVVVFKGARTIIADPSGAAYINPTGNPGMATAGSGDVLTGAIAGLIAQGLAPFEAAIAGVYIHGLAGDLALEDKGEAGLLAGDILERLPLAETRLRKGR